MADVGTLVYKILGDTKDIKKKLAEVDKRTKQTSETTQKFSKSVKGAYRAFIGYTAAITATIMTMRKLTQFVRSSIDAYAESEAAMTKLNAALKATGRYTPNVSEEMQKYAEEMKNLTGISDEAILSAQGIMATFTQIGNETFPEAIEAAMNMSTMFGQDLQQSVIQLGTALNDPIRGVGRLRRIGISFSEEQKKSIELFMEQNDLMSAQRVILDELNVEIGNTARAMGETYVGKMNILKETIGDLKEEIGEFIAGKMEPMIPTMTNIVLRMKDWIEHNNELAKAYALLALDMKEVTDQTLLEIKQAEQLIAIDDLKRLRKKQDLEVSTSILGSIKKETSEIPKMIAQLEREIRQRAQLIDNMKLAGKMRDEEAEKIRKEIEERETALKKLRELEKTEAEELKEKLEKMTQAWEEQVDFYDEIQDKATRLAIEYEALMNRTNDLTESTKEYVRIASGVTENTAYMIDTIRIAKEVTEEFEEAQEKLNQRIEDQTNTIFPMWTDAWFTIQSTVGSAATRMKEVFKGLFSDLLIMLSKEALARALMAVAKLQFGRAAAWFTASAVAAVASQSIKELARGGMFETQGPEIIQVGDNPGGRERVEVTPLSSPNYEGPQKSITIPITFQVGSEVLYKTIQKGIDNKQIRVNAKAIR